MNQVLHSEMQPGHVYARKAARAIAAANAESNRPTRRRTRHVKRERTSLSPQSSWGTTTHEYLGEGFAVRSRP